MKNIFISLFFIIICQIRNIFSSKRNLSTCTAGSNNCAECDTSSSVCIRCQSTFALKGTNEGDANDVITCVSETSVSTGYYQSSNGVYYPCNSFEDNGICYRKDILAINNYYLLENYKYYNCSTIKTTSLGEIRGRANCHECQILTNTNTFKCTKCLPNYVFIQGDTDNICHSIEDAEIKTSQRYYKIDNQYYGRCSNAITNCITCTSSSRCTQCNTNYYTINNAKYKCVLLSDIADRNKYYLEDNTYYSCSLNGGVQNCLECTSKTTCTECKPEYTIVDNNLAQCIKISSLDLKRYYFDSATGRYFSCNNPITYCLECNNNRNLCSKCEEGYVFVNDVKTECIYENGLINNNIYLKIDSKNYKSCSNIITNCLTCESEHKCLSCNSGGILDEDYTQCQAIPADGTTFREENLYYTCNKIIEGCLKCNSRNVCIQTISSNYCIKNDGSVLKLNEIDNYFYSSTNYKCISCGDNSKDGIPNCLLCSSSSTTTRDCNKCQDGFTMIDRDTTTCDYIAGYNNNNEYFTIDNGINYYHCYRNDLTEKAIQNCKKCEYDSTSGRNNCLECNNNYIILDDDGSICILKSTLSSEKNGNKIIENSSQTKYYRCNTLISNCEKCTSFTNCDTCMENYVFLNNDKTKCLPKSDYANGHYFTNDGVNYYPCMPNCYECEDPLSVSKCITCDNGYEINDFDQCEKILYNEDDIKKNCVLITKEIPEANSESNIENQIKHDVKDYYDSFKNKRHYVVKYINNHLEYTLIVLKNDECSLFLYEDNNFGIDTKDIITELKKTYTDTKDIIQCMLIYKNHTAFNYFENKDDGDDVIPIDIETLCPACLQKKYTLKYNYKNKIENIVGPKFTELIKDSNIDIFNEKSEFFQTFCPNLLIDGIDVPLNERLYILYQGNLSYNLGDPSKGDLFACNINCTLVNNYPENYTAECACDLKYEISDFITEVDGIEEDNSESSSDLAKKEINKDYKISNNSKDSFQMFTCTKYAFKSENIKKNAGFYVVTISFVSQAVCLTFLLFQLKLNSFAKLLVLANPPKSTSKYVGHRDKEENKVNNEENNNKRILQRISENDYYLTSNGNGENKNNTYLPSTNKRYNYEEEDSEEEKQNKFEHNGEIHHQRLNIYNNNFVTPSKINLTKSKYNNNKKNNISSDESDTNNDDDIFKSEKNSEMDYYPVMKFIEFDVNVYRDIGYSYEQKDIKELRKKYEGVKVIQYNLLNKNEKTKLIPLIYKSLLKDHLPPKYGIYYDKRNFCFFYFYLFCLRQPIVNLFLKINHNSSSFIPFSVKLIKLIFLGIAMLFFNALFINQKYIYDKYNFFDEKFHFDKLLLSDTINSSEKLSYAIKHTFVNSIFTYLIIMVVDMFLTWLFSIRRRVKNLLDEYYEIDSGRNSNVSRYNKQRRNFEKDLLEVSDLKCTYIWITSIFYIFMIVFFIYLVNFCSTYKGVVADLFFAGLWTFIIYVLMPIFSSLFISILRFLGLKAKIHCIYNLSRILMEI